MLQWGRGDDAAERTRTVSTANITAELQWGRGDDAAERSDGRPAEGVCTRRFNGAAAMTPRKGERATSPIIAGIELQWGRGDDAAESPQFDQFPDRKLCFNGAAAMTPRKGHGHLSRHRGHAMMLQWGRGDDAAERGDG